MFLPIAYSLQPTAYSSMESISLWASTFFYLFSFSSTLLALRTKQLRPGRFSFVAIFLGVVCQSWFLVLRGKGTHACPITTLPEMLIFLSWAIGWFYLLIGSTYRVSLMGAFTAPLILIFQSIGFFFLPPAVVTQHCLNSWIETHAALSLVAFGALGLAGVSAAMFLFQEAQLKSQAPAPIFHFLPPMQLLEITTARLLWLGLVLLTMSFVAGALSGISISGMKFWISFLLWGFYGLLGVAQQARRLSAHRFAQGVVLIFLFALGVLFKIA
ncbi:MAG: hypothetical protein FJ390_00745 [Verrucomicrobia bacterium]|nr:hypothetical protein [Verrucomicrobiota bacterium]